MKKVIITIFVIVLLTACGNRLNPEWYPNGTGKDTVCTVGNGKFSLGKTTAGMELTMYKDDGSTGVLLAFVEKYKKHNQKLYVVSKEGFCVIDYKENTAKTLIIVEKQYFSNIVGEDTAIKYLSSFDEFSVEEQEIINGMIDD